jgi:hypothetical protein
MDEYASKRPILEELDITSSSWIGADAPSLYGEKEYLREDTPVREIFLEANREALMEGKLLCSTVDLMNLIVSILGIDLQQMHHYNQSELNFMSEGIYHDLMPPAVEANLFMKKVRELFEYSVNIPQFHSKVTDSKQHAKVEAVQHYLRLHPDGTPLPLSVMEFFRFGTFHNKLVKRIKKLRGTANELKEQLVRLEESGFSFYTDIFLVQTFVIEQFSFLKRYVLRYKFFDTIGGFCPPKISVWPWLMAWTVIYLR